MNTAAARDIVCNVAHLAELAATFNARYGTHYRLTNASPREAIAMYNEILAVQTQIAALLDDEAVTTACSRYGEWWKRMDVMDTALLNELASEGFGLIARCAYMSAGEPALRANADMVLQRSIAGLLHPATRKVETTDLLRKAI